MDRHILAMSQDSWGAKKKVRIIAAAMANVIMVSAIATSTVRYDGRDIS